MASPVEEMYSFNYRLGLSNGRDPRIRLQRWWRMSTPALQQTIAPAAPDLGSLPSEIKHLMLRYSEATDACSSVPTQSLGNRCPSS